MWTILRDINDWEKYQTETARQLGLVSHMQVGWGNGPSSYPCLVCTYCPPQRPGENTKLVSAYVYEHDAKLLLALVKPATPAFAVAKLEDVNALKLVNRHMIGYVLTLIWAICETGIIKKDVFEAKLGESLELHDEWARGDVEEVRTKTIPTQQAFLEGLKPKE